VKYVFIRDHQQEFRIARMCGVLQVSRSGFYGWLTRPASAHAVADRDLAAQIIQRHHQTRRVYGAVKLWRTLNDAGIACGKHRVARLRRSQGLEATRRRRFRVMTEHHQLPPPAPNRLQQHFAVARPNRVWVGDITAIPTRAGWLYLAAVLDLYSRRVVGWAMSPRADRALATDALTMALRHRQPQPGLIHHTDQGCQYVATAYRQVLAQHGLVTSMSRRGNCYDNAVAESFFSTLKNELVHDRTFQTRDEARSQVFEFIEVFYNRQRMHQTLGYVSPVAFEARRVVP
jgi:transposase InsO family protein